MRSIEINGYFFMKNKNIQFLRGISIILILISHADVIYPKEINFLKSHFDPTIGVDLFFIISGYLMGVTFLNKIDGSISVLDTLKFYVKRTNRLFVPCVFWASIPVLFISYWKDVGMIQSLGQSIWIFITSIIFVGNFFNYIHPSGFGYFWSLGVEYQFYLLLPFIVFFGKTRAGIFKILFLIFILYTFSMRDFDGVWLFRANSLYVGLMIWMLTKSNAFTHIKDKINNASSLKVLIFCISLIVFSTAASAALFQFKSISYSIVSITLGLSFMISLCKDLPIAGFLSSPFEFIGDISFSLYLCNIPVIVFVSNFLFNRGFSQLSVLVFSMVLCVFCSAISRYTLEKINIIK